MEESNDYGFVEELKRDKYPKLPTQDNARKDKEDKFLDGLRKIDENKDTKKFAKDNGYYVGSSGFVTFLEVLVGILIVILLIGALVGGYFFLRFVNDGKFQSIDNSTCNAKSECQACQECTVCGDCGDCNPSILINFTTSNYYENSS